MHITKGFHGTRILKQACAVLIVSVFLWAATGFTDPGDDAGFPADAVQTVSGMDLNDYIRVRLPESLADADLENPSAETRRRIDAAIRRQLERLEVPGCDVIVLVDADGRAVLPDAQKAQRLLASGGGATLQAAAEKQLSFTFNSPDEPWTAEERDSVSTWAQACHEQIRTIYGPPAFANVVNIRKSTSISNAGVYSSGTNEITLKSIYGHVLCHEMVHAFHDDYILSQSTWEEGFARAVETEACKRAGIETGSAHDYYYDVAYEELNRPVVGAKNGRIWAGWSQTLLRYQLSGYAWAKAMIEDDTFFVNFNEDMYAAATADRTVLSDEAQLKLFVSDAKPTIEEKDFDIWYTDQHVLNTDPPTGNLIYIRADNYQNVSIYLLNRQASGMESDLGGMRIDWTAADYEGNVFASGSGITTDYGWVRIDDPAFRNHHGQTGYDGRVEITAWALVDGEQLEETAYVKGSPGDGVFGVIVGADTGTVRLAPRESGLLSVSVPVRRGAFQAEGLLPVRGRIQYVFTAPDGDRTDPVVFTKDDTPYFLHIDFEPSGGCDRPGPCS